MIDNDVFPTDISTGSKGGPVYSTIVVESASGREQRIQNWARTRGKWDVSHGVKTLAQLLALETFFHARAGAARGFLFRDPLDYLGTNEALGVGNGTQTVFQLVRNYASGGVTRTRKITRPLASTVVVSVAGSPVSATVDATTGLVTLSSAPASGAAVTATFQHYLPARFEKDEMSVSLDGVIGGWESISVIEILE